MVDVAGMEYIFILMKVIQVLNLMVSIVFASCLYLSLESEKVRTGSNKK